jgi:hypothetical protein
MGYQNHQLYMQVANNHLSLSGEVIHKKLTNFVSLGLYQYLIKLKNGEMVVYEDARTDLSYEFEPSIHRIIQIVFDAKYLVPIYGEGHLYAYQVVMPNDRVLNLIGYQSDTQDLKLVYGMSTKTFNSMIHALNPNAKGATYTQVLKVGNQNNPFISKWDDMKVHFVPLVVPYGKFMAPF